MKIGQSAEKPASVAVGTERASQAEAGRAKSSANTSASSKTAPEASAKVALSSTASTLMSAVADEGTFDTAKVQRISNAIAQGQFKINPEAVADKLIANAKEMLNRASATH